jgi:hypothetical protein
MGKCSECIFFKLFGEVTGQCLRYPPRVMVDSNGFTVSSLPDVEISYWCGEFRHIKEPAVDSVMRQLAEAAQPKHTPFE